jgi:hypothetical protein
MSCVEPYSRACRASSVPHKDSLRRCHSALRSTQCQLIARHCTWKKKRGGGVSFVTRHNWGEGWGCQYSSKQDKGQCEETSSKAINFLQAARLKAWLQCTIEVTAGWGVEKIRKAIHLSSNFQRTSQTTSPFNGERPSPCLASYGHTCDADEKKLQRITPNHRDAWRRKHSPKCDQNYVGTAKGMEKEAATQLWSRWVFVYLFASLLIFVVLLMDERRMRVRKQEV